MYRIVPAPPSEHVLVSVSRGLAAAVGVRDTPRPPCTRAIVSSEPSRAGGDGILLRMAILTCLLKYKVVKYKVVKYKVVTHGHSYMQAIPARSMCTLLLCTSLLCTLLLCTLLLCTLASYTSKKQTQHMVRIDQVRPRDQAGPRDQVVSPDAAATTASTAATGASAGAPVVSRTTDSADGACAIYQRRVQRHSAARSPACVGA